MLLSLGTPTRGHMNEQAHEQMDERQIVGRGLVGPEGLMDGRMERLTKLHARDWIGARNRHRKTH